MDISEFVLVSRQSALMRQAEVVSNNLANLHSTGYRQENPVFSEFVKGLGQGPSVSFAAFRSNYFSIDQGALTQTGNPLDVAISGEGFFLLSGQSGQELTRSGNFSVDQNNQLVAANGSPVLGAAGAPIILPNGSADVSISRDGTIQSGGQVVDQIAVVQPADDARLSKVGGSAFSLEGGFENVESAAVLQGHLEGSNVNQIDQLTSLIEIQRSFEIGQNLSRLGDDRFEASLDAFFK